MRLFGFNETTAVDIGAGSIKIVRIANGKRPRLLSADLLELPLEGFVKGGADPDLKLFLTGKKLEGRNVVTQISGRHLTVRHVSLPLMPESELRQAVRWEARRFISYPLGEAIVEYLVVGQTLESMVQKYNILIVAAPRSTIMEHVKPFTEAGIKITAIDANALALRNVLLLGSNRPEENILVLDMGAGKTEINIFKNGDPRFSRYLEIGGIDITRSVSRAQEVGLQEAEDLKQKADLLSPTGEGVVPAAIRCALDEILLEIERSVEYYKVTFREQRVGRMILTGGGSLMTGMPEYFARSFEGTVECDDPFAALSSKTVEQFKPLGPRFSSAVGLALRKG